MHADWLQRSGAQLHRSVGRGFPPKVVCLATGPCALPSRHPPAPAPSKDYGTIHPIKNRINRRGAAAVQTGAAAQAPDP